MDNRNQEPTLRQLKRYYLLLMAMSLTLAVVFALTAKRMSRLETRVCETENDIMQQLRENIALQHILKLQQTEIDSCLHWTPKKP